MIPRRLHILHTYISLSFGIVIPFLKTYSTNFLPIYSRVDHKDINFTVICNSCVHSIHIFHFYFSVFWGERCAGPPLLCELSLAVENRVSSLVAVCGLLTAVASLVKPWLQRSRASVAVARGLGSGAPGSGAQAQQLWCLGLAVLQHEGSSWTRD